MPLLNYKKDGTAFWNMVQITPLKNAEGEIALFLGLQSEISERRLSQKKVRIQL